MCAEFLINSRWSFSYQQRSSFNACREGTQRPVKGHHELWAHAVIVTRLPKLLRFWDCMVFVVRLTLLPLYCVVGMTGLPAAWGVCRKWTQQEKMGLLHEAGAEGIKRYVYLKLCHVGGNVHYWTEAVSNLVHSVEHTSHIRGQNGSWRLLVLNMYHQCASINSTQAQLQCSGRAVLSVPGLMGFGPFTA